MSVAVTCPECQERYQVTDEAAQQPIRCRRCQCPIEAKRHAPASEGIQAKPAPVLGSASRQREDDDDPQLDRSHPHPKPRSPFPWTALLVVVIGLLFLLLVFSVGFNVWFIANPDKHLRMDEARRAEQVAIQQRMDAERAAAMAQQEEKRARDNLARAQADLAAAKKLREEGDQPWGALQGRVVWKGELPKVKDLEGVIRMNAPKLPILNAPKGTFLDPTWRIHPKTKGVANVAVYLKRPADGMLPIHPDDRVRKDPVVMDAPFCVFVPHLVPLYPEWFDGKEGAKTGQKLVIKNSSPVPQNARIAGNLRFNEGRNRNLPPSAELECVLNPQPLPVEIKDDIYTWKKAYAWVFDHPYFAITDADGAFTIPRVPADTQLQVMAWHESQGWLFTKDGRTVRLTKGKNTLDFEMSAK